VVTPGDSNKAQIALPATKGQTGCEFNLAIQKESKDSVDMDITMMSPGVVKTIQRIHTRLPFDKPTEIALNKNVNDPCCAEVTVRRVPLPQPALVQMPVPVPMPPPLPIKPLQFPPNYMPAPLGLPTSMPIPVPPAAPCTPYTCPTPVPAPQICLPGMPCMPSTPAPCVNCPSCVNCPQCVTTAPCAVAIVTKKIATSHISIVQDKGKPRLCVKNDHSTMTCVKMTLDVGSSGAFTVAANKKNRIHISGKEWNAYADTIDVRDDGSVVLRGNVKVMGDKVDLASTPTKAKAVRVNVQQGTFAIDVAK
jgi:hypothetical protein